MFVNRIRLPFQLYRPQFPEEREVFRKADGTVKVQSAVIRKTYNGDTDFWPENWHERFKIALSHDNVTVEGDKYFGGIVQDGNYQINWPDFLDYPTAKAEFTVQVTPFNATNDSCSTCEELQQINLVDNTFPDPLEEGETYNMNVIENDSVCCYPATFTITSYNTSFLESATIDDEGVVTITLKAEAPSATGALLLTYRVTCPNGGYDEANVYGNTTGSVESCQAPDNIYVCVDPDVGTASLCWDAVEGAESYSWELYSTDSLGVPEQSGTTEDTTVSLVSLIEEYPVTYTFYVKTNCATGSSEFGVPVEFENKSLKVSCGRYRLTYVGQLTLAEPKPFTYLGCLENNGEVNLNGLIRNGFIHHYTFPCMLQLTPGIPVYLQAPDVIVEYLELCE